MQLANECDWLRGRTASWSHHSLGVVCRVPTLEIASRGVSPNEVISSLRATVASPSHAQVSFALNTAVRTAAAAAAAARAGCRRPKPRPADAAGAGAHERMHASPAHAPSSVSSVAAGTAGASSTGSPAPRLASTSSSTCSSPRDDRKGEDKG